METKTLIKKTVAPTHDEISEVLAKFIGGKYAATIKVKDQIKRVVVDISELDVRKELGYTFQYSFATDYNVIMPVLTKIIGIGYLIQMDDFSVTIYRKTDDGEKKLITKTSLRAGTPVTVNTLFYAAYKFVRWYNEKKTL